MKTYDVEYVIKVNCNEYHRHRWIKAENAKAARAEFDRQRKAEALFAKSCGFPLAHAFRITVRVAKEEER